MHYAGKIRQILTIAAAAGAMAAAGALELQAQMRVFARVDPNRDAVSASADLYDTSAGRIGPASIPGLAARSGHTATLLPDGKVLLAGGFDGRFLKTAQVYNPADGSVAWTSGSMTAKRSDHTATVLEGGKILLAGGYDGSPVQGAELYDPYFGTFTATTGAPISGRTAHTATRLQNNKVLIVGGLGAEKTAELYAADTNSFQTTGSLANARSRHTATLLADGKVLIVGGESAGVFLKTAELYDPAAGTFSPAAGGLTTGRSGHTATLLANGKVLIAGGYNGSNLNTAELYDPAGRTFTAVSGNMVAARADHTSVALSGGRALLVGGTGTDHLSSAEIYEESGNRFTAVATVLAERRGKHTATVLSNGNVLIAGGLKRPLTVFDVNLDPTDNISPNILFSADSKYGYVPYAGSGQVVVFSTETGAVVQQIKTGGKPAFATPLADSGRCLVVSALDNKVFLVDTASNSLVSTYTFNNALFGFGSIITVTPDGNTGYISSTGTGEVIQFATADGKEIARLKGLQAPAQATLTKDGATLLVVDTVAEEMVFAATSGMTKKTSFKATTTKPEANFTIFSKAVLSPGGESAIVASRDNNGILAPDTAFVFSTSSAAILDTRAVVSEPCFTGITPDGKYWVIYGDLSLTVVPTTDPGSKFDLSTPQGGPLGSANLVFSPDSRQVYYASAEADEVFQHELDSGAVVGRVTAGDDPNEDPDQTSSLAMTPDGKTIAALDFRSNSLDLLRRVKALDAPKFTSASLIFSGLTLVNTGPAAAGVTITAYNNYGELMTGITNPVGYTLPANGQISLNVQEIFGLNPAGSYTGRLQVTSDRQEVVGYLSIGEASLTYLGFFLHRMDGTPLYSASLHDFIIPEIVLSDGAAVELNYLNRNFNQSTYRQQRMAPDGGAVETREGDIAYPTNRLAQNFTDQFTVPGGGLAFFIGGVSAGTAAATSETYDPTSQNFLGAASLTTARYDHTATVLPNGKILVAGGRGASGTIMAAEIFDRSTNAFAAVANNMTTARERHTATRLRSGKVLLAGGLSGGSSLTNAEVFDPAAGSFTATTGEMTTARSGHTATLLSDGRVLIAGGSTGSGGTSNADLYDPETGAFAATGALTVARAYHTATLLTSGKVLIAGGHDGTNYLNSAELYDPATGKFTATGNLSAARQDHTATLLSNGNVLIAGGYSGSALNTADTYDAPTGQFGSAGTMTAARRGAAALVLPDKRVLIAGGTDGTNSLATAEVYNPEARTFSATNPMATARAGHTATFLESGSDGYIRITSKEGLIVSEYFVGAGYGAAMNGIDVWKFNGVTSVYAPIPALPVKPVLILNLINAGAATADVTLVLHRQDGSVIGSPVTAVLFKGAQLKAELGVLFPGLSDFASPAWLEVRSTIDRVTGTLTVTRSDASFRTSYELSGAPQNNLVIPVGATDGFFKTSVALLNAGADEAIATVELWSPEGTLDRSATVRLEPGRCRTPFLEELFPGVSRRVVGNVRIRSDRPIHAVGLLTDIFLDFIAAVPALIMP